MSSEIKFSETERIALEEKLQKYLSDELSLEIGRFDAGFLLDFITNQLGPAFYNRGVYDAQALLEQKIAEIRDDVLSLERPVAL
mgnify:FL=1